jgi:hypothetical protein
MVNGFIAPTNSTFATCYHHSRSILISGDHPMVAQEGRGHSAKRPRPPPGRPLAILLDLPLAPGATAASAVGDLCMEPFRAKPVRMRVARKGRRRSAGIDPPRSDARTRQCEPRSRRRRAGSMGQLDSGRIFADPAAIDMTVWQLSAAVGRRLPIKRFR